MAPHRNKTKFVLSAVLLIGIAALAVVFYQFRRQGAQLTGSTVVSKLSEKTIMSLDHVRQTATRDGMVQWELTADSAELKSGGNTMVLHAPKVDFFLKDGSQVHLTAEKGVLNTKSNDMQVQGKVYVRNDRYTLTTEMLAYQHERNTLQSDQPVRISGEEIDLTAAAMTYDLNTDQAQFSGQVNGLVRGNLGENLFL
jgi:LPS export ABC transporter protein LptC